MRRTADSEPCPLAVAVRGDVCSPTASEPLVPEPEAVDTAVLTLVEVSLDWPEPVAETNTVRRYAVTSFD